MNIISKTALSNFRKNKSRNILIGVAILLTSLLLTIVPTAVAGMLNVQFQAVNKVYPTFHAMYRNVDLKNVQKILEDENMEKVGLRKAPAYIVCENEAISASIVSIDENVAELFKWQLEAGTFPRKGNEIVVSQGLLDAMDIKGNIGDTITIPFQPVKRNGLGAMESKKFLITGITPTTEEMQNNGVYSALVSDAFVKEILSEEEQVCRVYVRLNGTEGKITDSIEAEVEEIGSEYGIKKEDIVTNSEYLMANYVDPALYSGIAIIMAVIVLAGILTIYSIYYVSMLDRVQEYGRLRAIGATRRQIRSLVFREGFAVAAIAVPAGILLGIVCAILLVRGIIQSGIQVDNYLTEEMDLILRNHEASLIKPWILCLAAVVSFAAVYVSLLRPMKIACKISPVEAIRYQGKETKNKKKKRKGYKEINVGKLTETNLSRNKKRTAMTIFTLGATGILFIVVATILSCMNPSTIAEQQIQEDIRVSLDSWEGDEMHPEREIQKIQQSNPLTDELKERLEQIPGVKSVEEELYVRAECPDVKEEDGEALQAGIDGINEKAMEKLEKYLVEGSLEEESLKNGTGIIISDRMSKIFPEKEWKAGDKVHLNFTDGENTVEKEFEIAAIVDAPYSLAGYYFTMPSGTLQSFCQTNLREAFEIEVESGKEDAAAEAVEELIANQEFLEINTWKAMYSLAEKEIGYMVYGCYGMLFVFGLIGILNLINTMVNSVYVRRRELGMLQAIGMSGNQMLKMLQMEGLFYTVGTVAMALGIGSLAGYGAFLWAKANSIMAIQTYHYPVKPAIVLVIVVLAVQLLITSLVSRNLKKVSLIERIRFAE